LNVPVIIAHAELHEPVAPLSVIGPVMLSMAKRAQIPVCVHLDHCETLTYMEQALAMGFTGVMYDGSALPYEANVGNTRRAVALAKRYGVGVEAEIGRLAAREGGADGAAGPQYTDPDDARRFAQATGIDALAASFGTVHGLYRDKPALDFERVRLIRQETGLPLVMHGGSGVSANDYRAAIASGIRKINYYTYMSRAGVQAVREALAGDVTFFHDLALAAKVAMRDDVKTALGIFSGQAPVAEAPSV